jgi:hypothetical protein
MRRLASAVSLALVFSIAACGSSSSSPSPDASPDTGAAAACTGSFAGINVTQLAGAVAAASGPKSCQADVPTICTGMVVSIAGACGINCLGMQGDAATTCVSTCIKGKVTLSDACNACYAATVVCTQTNCLSQCAADPTSAQCNQCQFDKNCRQTFGTCSGLPVGSPPGDGGAPSTDSGAPSDGGAGDAGAIDAAAGDGGADTAASDVAAATDSATD